MSILFSKRAKGVIKWIWIVIAILIILSMIFSYSGGMEIFTQVNA
jgi:hypothetical protein